MKHDQEVYLTPYARPRPLKGPYREQQTDNLTSFPPVTEEEAKDIKAWLRIDRASIYAT